MKKYLSLTVILFSLIFIAPAFAQKGEDHSVQVKSEATPIVANSPEALTGIDASLKAIDEMVANGKLDGIHAETEKTKSFLSAIGPANGEEDKKIRLESAIKQFNAQLDKLHDASDKGNKEAAATELKKARGALKLIKAALK